MSKQDLEKYYEILEIDNDASREEIIRAYNHLKNLYTSGSMATEPIDNEWDEDDKHDILQKIEDAYEKLLPLAAEDREIEDQIPTEDITGDITPIEEIPMVEVPFEEEQEEEPVEEEPVEEEPVEAPVMEEYANHAHHDVHEVHIELDDDAASAPVSDHEEESQLFGILDEVEDEDQEEEEGAVLEPEAEEPVPEEAVKDEAVEEDDTLAEEFVEPGPVSGSIFREIRETRGLSFQELSESTQIPPDMLEHIEREEFEKLPDAGYLRWYITTYAKTLSIDPKECADEYMKRYREWKKIVK